MEEYKNRYLIKYGKGIIEDVLDYIVIPKHMSKEIAREILIKHSYIKKNSKANLTTYIFATDRKIGNYYRFYIRNLRGQTYIDLSFNDKELQEILKELNETN